MVDQNEPKTSYEVQADHQPNDEKDNQSNMVTKDEVVQIINSAISSRFRSFEKKLDNMSQPQSQSQAEEPSQEEDVKFSKAEFNKLRKELNEIKKARDEDRNKLKQSKLDQELGEHLSKLGVSGQMLKHAKASLLHDQLVNHNEYDEIVFKNGQDELPLSQGLGSWIKEEGQAFLPATQAKGSGDRSYSSSSPNNSSKTLNNDELAAILRNGVV